MGSVLSWTANSVLFVLGCLLAADTANEVIASTLLAPPTEVSAPAPRSAEARQRTWGERQVILERNLFKSAIQAASVPDPDPIENVEKSRLPMDLLGTYAANDPSDSRATLRDREKNETLVVGVGDQLRGQALVLRIERRRVVLSENGAPRELTFGEDDGAKSAHARSVRRPSQAARRAPVRRTGEDRYEVSREEVQKNLRDPNNLLTQARVRPKFEAGEMVGLQVTGIKPGSLFEQIGLQNGDVITEFNGAPVDAPQERLQMLKELQEADEVQLSGVDASGQEWDRTYVAE